MRTVFTNDELPHLWAHARQNTGRNSGGSFFFDGDVIYSYGSHFPIARRINAELFAFTTESYSMTTAQHISRVRRAIPHEAKVLHVYKPDAASRDIIKRTEDKIAALLAKASTARKHRDSYLGDALQLANDFNAYAEANGESERISTTAVVGPDTEAALAALRAAQAERDRALREAEEKRRRRATEEAAEDLAAWRAGGPATWRLHGATVALRISPSPHLGAGCYEVQTSHGASIPVGDAKRLWPLVQLARKHESWRLVPGKSVPVGVYHLTQIRRDGSVVIGCHDIPYAELKLIADQLGLVES